MLKCEDQRLQSRAFFAQANLLAGGLLSQWKPFQERSPGYGKTHERSLSCGGAVFATLVDPRLEPHAALSGVRHPTERHAFQRVYPLGTTTLSGSRVEQDGGGP